MNTDVLNLPRLVAACRGAWQADGDAGVPHLLIEPLLDADVLSRVMGAFPGPDEGPVWESTERQSPDGKLQSHRKLVSCDRRSFPLPLQELIAALHGESFIRVIEEATGIHGLIPDESLYGGGLHHYLSGAFLGVHVDANVHPVQGLHRRLNLILYLNDPWDEDWRGALEFWSADGRLLRSIAPLANRCVVFATTPGAYHAISAVGCPPQVTRRSVMVRYYTIDRPVHELQPPHRVRWI
jgi:Rps23 Pro-64 3,4-dihydroxylase Tpa1-like proline 4-hydroxylase